MDIWTRLIGVAVALYAAYSIYRGRVSAGDENRTTYIVRSEKPVQFWLIVIFMLAVAVVMIFNVFHL
jgi:hypothetical protein